MAFQLTIAAAEEALLNSENEGTTRELSSMEGGKLSLNQNGYNGLPFAGKSSFYLGPIFVFN